MVVIAILLALTAFVVIALNASTGGDRLRSAARTAQSAFLGAKDRALHAKERRGIRLLRDATDGTLVNGFVYLQPIESLRYGLPIGPASPAIEILNIDTDFDSIPDAPRRVQGYGVDWDLLAQQGAFPFPPRIKVPATSNGQWYTFTNVTLVNPAAPRQVTLDLTTNYLSPTFAPPAPVALPTTDPNATCEIELAFEMLPHHAPIALPSGVVIDLDWSSPTVQSAFPLVPAPVNIDIIYGPRGMMAGAASALGPLYFLLNDIQDATQNLNPIDPANRGEKLVLTVFPQTGHVQTYPIDPTDARDNATGAPGADGLADDLFRFAKLGSRSGS
ncbi:MAG: pilus assembly FimT family protein [Planctomycetaceae bacterium]